MKILQVTQSFKPMWYYGGVVRSVYEISKQLVESGHDVTVYTSNRAGLKDLTKNRMINVDGIKVYYFENIDNYIPIRFTTLLPVGLPFVARKDIENYDIIHIHEHRTLLAAIVYYYAKKNNIPIVLQPRGSIQRLHKNGIKKIYDELIGYEIIKNSKAVLLSSKKELRLSEEIFNKIHFDYSLIRYIPNGTDLPIYDKLPSKNNVREKYNIKKSEKMILYLGRLHEVKGLDILVETFYRLMSEVKNVKLVIVGPDGGYKSKLTSMITKYGIDDNVILINGLFGREKLAAYSAADVFVLPSKVIESFGNVALESLVCGVPTVVTNVCGISEWTDELIVVEPNPESMKYGIKKALTMKKKKFNEKNNNLKKFYWYFVTNKIMSIYEYIHNKNLKSN